MLLLVVVVVGGGAASAGWWREYLSWRRSPTSQMASSRTVSRVSRVWAADTQKRARDSMMGVAGKPTTTVPMFLCSISRPNALETNNNNNNNDNDHDEDDINEIHEHCWAHIDVWQMMKPIARSFLRKYVVFSDSCFSRSAPEEFSAHACQKRHDIADGAPSLEDSASSGDRGRLAHGNGGQDTHADRRTDRQQDLPSVVPSSPMMVFMEVMICWATGGGMEAEVVHHAAAVGPQRPDAVGLVQ
ncbi:hypothetical protein CRUP_026662, partial [Coryphaenoides rupestris]